MSQNIGKYIPQSQPLNKRQVQNHAGGYVYDISLLQQVKRWLILGSQGGTYYVSERNTTIENIGVVRAAVKNHPTELLDLLYEVNKSNAAVKRQPLLYALAALTTSENLDVRQSAYIAVGTICRTGKDLLEFVHFALAMRGKGSGLTRAIARWYNHQPARALAYQVLKYDGINKNVPKLRVAQSDLIRMAHPKPSTGSHSLVSDFVRRGTDALSSLVEELPTPDIAPYLDGYAELQATPDANSVIDLIRAYDFTNDMIPERFLSNAQVWEALLGRMPLHAMVRNLNRMTAYGVLQSVNDNTRKVVNALANEEWLNRSHMHPLALLNALMAYNKKYADAYSRLDWTPIPEIAGALEQAFYLAFGNVQPTGQRVMLALDISPSMRGEKARIAGMNMNAMEASAALALVTARTEPDAMFRAFSGGFVDPNIHGRMTLDQTYRQLTALKYERTDCALPMLIALRDGIAVDAFVIYTDNETWSGETHPMTALKQYRERTGIPAKLIVVGMTATSFTIADPRDVGCLDIAGFDTATPSLISAFIRGEV